MAKVAAGHMFVTTKSGEVHHFSPGDPLPSWAQRVIRNPDAIEDDSKAAAKPAPKSAATKKSEPAKKAAGQDEEGKADGADSDSDGAGDDQPEAPEADSPEDTHQADGDGDDEMSPVFDPKA